MPAEQKKEVIKLSLGDRIKNNRLVSITIILGIFGIVFPLLGWILDVTSPLQSQDLERLRDDLVNIQKISSDIQKVMDRIIATSEMSGSIRSWKLNDHEREILKKMSEGQRTHISAIFNLIVFSLQGSFFILIGVLIERKILAPRQIFKKREGEAIMKDSTKEHAIKESPTLAKESKESIVRESAFKDAVVTEIVTVENTTMNKDNSLAVKESFTEVLSKDASPNS